MQERRPVVQIAGLEVSLGGNPILKGLNLNVYKGELFALLGPNGAGKSTLTQSIIGQIKPGKGQIRISGRDPCRNNKTRQAVGLVPQHVALYEKLTPKENLTAFGAIMGMSRRNLRLRSKELLDRVGLSDRTDDQVRRLSGGMQRRVNIAAALMHDPSLLLLDEPTVGLDHHAQIDIAELLRDLRSDGAAIMLVTHDLSEAELLADRLAILVQGKIRAIGNPAQLIEDVFRNLRDVRILAPQGKCPGPDGHDLLWLENLGLFPDASGKHWSGVLPSDDPRLAILLDAIGRQELSTKEVTIRRPGLEKLLARCIADAERDRV